MLALVAVGLDLLPLSADPLLLPTEATGSCHIEPIDVCGAGDASLGVLSATPHLVAAVAAVIVPPGTSFLTPDHRPFLPEGFTPDLDRPPRRAC